MLVLAVTQVLVGGWLEAWPRDARGFQHQMGFHAEARHALGPLEGSVYIGMIWWGRREAKIPGSFLNAEAGQLLERHHGAALMLRQGPCAVGGWVGRRAIMWFWQEGRWGRAAEEQLAAGEPWPTLAYHDGVGAAGICESPRASLHVRTGPMRHLNVSTLPWHEAWARAELRTADSMEVSVMVEAGGPRPGTAFDVAVGRALGGAFWLEVHGGALSYPGFERPLRRLALVLRVRHRPSWWP